jgi:hypothetical protein
MLFLLNITIVPLLVAAVSIVARRFGPTIGGLLMGVPWMTGPVLFFLGIERGTDWLAAIATGVLLAVVSIATYVVAFTLTSRYTGFALCIGVGALAYAASGLAVSEIEVALDGAALASLAALLVAIQIMPRKRSVGPAAALPWWDIPARMLATVVLVTAIALTTDLLGPRLSGLLASFPIITTVIGAFTLQRWGHEALAAMLRAQLFSLLSFVAYFWVLGTLATQAGFVWAHVAAVAVAMLASGVLLWVMRRLAARPA